MSSDPNRVPSTISTLCGGRRGLDRRAYFALPFLAAAIAVLFALSLVAGCGGGSEESGRSGSGVEDDDSGAPGDDDADDDSGGTDDDDDDTTADDDGDPQAEFHGPWPVWVTIPAGEFEMGCSPGDDLCDEDEFPVRTVVLPDGFLMTATEITQEQYFQFYGTYPSEHVGCEDCPVESVWYLDAEEFCSGLGGRLPTEAEWEYAARRNHPYRYYCGDDESCLIDYSWVSMPDAEEIDGTNVVALKFPNDFGLYDMLGNVSEYVYDVYDRNYYGSRTDPDTAPTGPESGQRGQHRGGNWTRLGYSECRVSARTSFLHITGDSRVGFRCVKSESDLSQKGGHHDEQ